MSKEVMPNGQFLPEVARLVAEGESVCIKTKGSSMHPFIRGGKDSVILESAEGFGVMDIVLAEIEEGVYVLHRVVDMDGNKVVLMGDGNIKGREMCMRKDVKAKAVAIVKDGRRLECNRSLHIVCAQLWQWLLPARRYLLAIYRRTGNS